jgi:hypothetical protein
MDCKNGATKLKDHYRPPALQLGRATGQEGTGFQDLTLSGHSGFKDLVFSTGQLDSPETSILRFGRWLLDIGLHWLQMVFVFLRIFGADVEFKSRLLPDTGQERICLILTIRFLLPHS